MTSPSGWREPGQTPEFDEYTVVLRGELQVETRSAIHKVAAGQAILVDAGEWVRYSTPGAGGRRVHRGLLAGVFAADGAPR